MNRDHLKILLLWAAWAGLSWLLCSWVEPYIHPEWLQITVALAILMALAIGLFVLFNALEDLAQPAPDDDDLVWRLGRLYDVRGVPDDLKGFSGATGFGEMKPADLLRGLGRRRDPVSMEFRNLIHACTSASRAFDPTKIAENHAAIQSLTAKLSRQVAEV